MDALKRSNLHAAYAHIGSFLLLIALFSYYSASHKHAKAQTFRYTIPIPDDPPDHIPVGGPSCNSDNAVITQSAGQCSTAPLYAPPKKTYSFNIIYGCLTFFLITAFAHIFYATDGFNSGKYSEVIRQGWNPYRWAEYAVSASVMTILIAYSLGIRDSNHLTSLVFINVALQSCGFLVENALIQPIINRTTVKGATFIGWTLLAGLWIPIVYAFITIVNDINNNFSGQTEQSGPAQGKPIKLPGWVWFIVIAQIFNFSCFGFIQAGQVRDALGGRMKPFDVYEKRYIFLSYAGKLALAGGLAYGLIFRTRKCL